MTGQSCQNGTCQGGTPVPATPPTKCQINFNPCIIGVCDGSGNCLNAINAGTNVACSNLCVSGGICNGAGQCVGGTAKACTGGTFCAPQVCDPSNGGCTLGTIPVGASCGVCQSGATCDQNGNCSGGNPLSGGSCGDCFQGGTCSNGSCVGGTQLPDGTSCDNGSGVCSSGVCSVQVQIQWRGQPNPLVIRQGTQTYSASVLTATGTPPGGTFTWSSSDTAVVDFDTLPNDNPARIIGERPGRATITVTYVNGQLQATASVDVQVIYPIVLVHGFNSSSGTWNALSSALSGINLQQGDFNCKALGNFTDIDFCAVDFCSACTLFGGCTQPGGSCQYGGSLPEWGSFSSFIDEGAALQTMVANLRNATGATQVTLVAHSMGGLASRAYLELFGGGSSVNRLITFGTPNLGSPYANMADDPILSDSIIGLLATIFMLHPDSPAVQGMDPKSSELENLNVLSAGALPRLPITSYVSIVGKASPLESTAALVVWNGVLAAFCDPFFHPDLLVCLDLAARTPDMDVFFFDSDLVVSTDSQFLVNAIPAASPCLDVVTGITHFGEAADAAEFIRILGLNGNKPCP